MKISVITVVYNDITGIEKTIQSIHAQSWDDVEHIVVDGGSTDGTLDVLNRYRSGIAVLISEPDRGIYDAMNKGANKATGAYMLFMNSGDYFNSDDVLARFAAGNPEADIVYGHALLTSPDGKAHLFKGNMDDILKKMPFSHQACFVKTNVQNNLRFDCTYSISGDFDFVLRAYKSNYRFEEMDFLIAVHELSGVSNDQRFRSSIESVHALLNFDSNMDIRDSVYYTRYIIDGCLSIDNGKMLEQFVASIINCRETPLASHPVDKVQHALRMAADFVRFYLNKSKRSVKADSV